MAEAEPLMRRVVEIFMNFTRATGHPHPKLMDAVDNYRSLLMEMGKSQDDADAQIKSICPELFP